MSLRVLIVSLLCACSAMAGEAGAAALEPKYGGAVDDYFREEVWAKVGELILNAISDQLPHSSR